jgi:hypothetical protein
MITDYSKAKPVPSPNFWEGRSGFDVRYIVMHGTALHRLIGPLPPRDVTNTSPITKEQQAASTALVADIRRRHGNLPLIPHSAISPISRAHCPGPGFPMGAINRDSLVTETKPATGPRFLIIRDMMARTEPDPKAVKWPVQMVHKGAVLDGTGQQTPHWVQVEAGGHPVWVLLANTRPV